MLCVIRYHLDNFRNVENTHRGVLLLGNVQAEVCDFTKRTPRHCFFSRCLNVQMVPNRAKRLTFTSPRLWLERMHVTDRRDL